MLGRLKCCGWDLQHHEKKPIIRLDNPLPPVSRNPAGCRRWRSPNLSFDII